MPKQLLIVFVKNLVLGKVKTRLAKTIGDEGALNVYKKLIDITQKATQNVKVDKHIYFSDNIDETLWKNNQKFTQTGNTIGDRMSNAFKNSFDRGYEQVILIGSDIPDLTTSIINNGFNALKNNHITFGPAVDGGYYLIGMSKYIPSLFINKPWSQPQLLKQTIKEVELNNFSYQLLQPLNDIDTFEDLKESSIYNEITSKLLPQS